MAYQGRSQGENPQGETVTLPIGGIVKMTETPLGANEAWSNTWQEGKLKGANAVHVSMSSDQAGSYTIQFSNDGINPINFAIASIAYSPSIVKAFQFGVAPKAKYFRLIYTNGPVAQTELYIEIRFSDSIQETVRSIGAPITNTQLAALTKGPMEQPATATNTSAAFLQPTASVVSSRIGMDVNVLNPTVATDVSALATAANQTNGSQKTQITNFPATQPVSGSVSVSNFPTSTEIANDVGNPIPVSGTVAVSNTGFNVNNFPATQAVSASSLPLPAGAAQEHTSSASPNASRLSDGTNFYDARQVRALTSSDVVTIANPVSSVSVSNFPSSQAVTGPLTDTQLRASAVPVTFSGTQNANTTETPNIPLYRNLAAFGSNTISSSANKVITGYEFFSPNAFLVILFYNSASTSASTTTYHDFVEVPQATTLLISDFNLSGFTNGIAFSCFTIAGTVSSPTLTITTNSQPVRMTLRTR